MQPYFKPTRRNMEDDRNILKMENNGCGTTLGSLVYIYFLDIISDKGMYTGYKSIVIPQYMFNILSTKWVQNQFNLTF